MAISKHPKKEISKDIELLKSDVASFASSIGLSSSIPSSGFDDSDFRKKGTLKSSSEEQSVADDKKPEKKGKFKHNRWGNGVSIDTTNNLKKAAEKSKHGVRPIVVDNSKGPDDKNLPKLPLMKANSLGIWYEHAADLEAKVIGKEANKMVEFRNVEDWKSLVEKKKELAKRLLAQYVQDYESSKGQSGDIKMLFATQRSGTAADKVSAFSVMVGDNPVAALKSLDALLGMVTSKVGKRHALTGFEALKELFISSLLPDRKLKTLFQRPINHLSESKDAYTLLLFWYWEECLKERYERFVIALEEASRDVLAILKDKSLKIMYALLRSKSEQERRLLSSLVNKLGDPENKAASNADFHLSKLLADHPNMKTVVIDEVDNFLFRPHLGLRAKYHAVNFLSQIRLYHKGDGPKIAKHLIDVYFALFKVLITEAGGGIKVDKDSKEDSRPPKSSNDKKVKNDPESHVEMDSRLLTALLTGVNRAFPYVSSSEADDVIEVQTPMLFQLVHSKNFNVGVQALMLLDKISSKSQIVSDRFYRALYSKLLLPSAMNSSKEEMFIGLLLRSMKSDINLKRVAAFSKRLLQVALQQPPQYACGCLFLLSEVLKARPPLWSMVLQNESVDEDLEHFEDIAEEAETPPCPASQKSDSAGEVVCSRDDNSSDDSELSSDEDGTQSSSSEDDALDEQDDDLLLGAGGDLNYILEESRAVSDHNNGHQPEVSNMRSSLPGGYDLRHREPSYCNADRVSWWELMVLASHVHPSVATMARTILSGANIVYNGNPLKDLSLPAFIDKFMEKKPKQNSWHGGSQIEPAKKLDLSNQLIGAEILSLAEVDVPPEDLVFHKFYLNKMSSSKKPKKTKKKGAVDDAAEDLFAVDGDDESDNDEIENMLDSSADPSLMADGGGYDYDDLDQLANEDDDDIVGNLSDEDGVDFAADITEEEDEDPDEIINEGDEDDDVEMAVTDDDDNRDEDEFDIKKRKRSNKTKKKHASASPFASLEDYEHLFTGEDQAGKKSKENRSTRSRKKRNIST